MNANHLAAKLWGPKAKFSTLFIVAFILLFTFLGQRDIWTQEHRWADIVSGMFYRHDFLHPYLGMNTYYDKPLLSYWLIVCSVKITGIFTAFTLRLPSALAGLLAVWSIYRLGTTLKNKSFGLLAGWLLLTTYYFIFWARVSSADMLNLAGSLFAVAWYMDKKDQPNFYNYSVFFLIVALTSLCKGLVGAIIPVIAVLTHLTLTHSWKRHIHATFFLSLLPALCVYLLPFLASAHFGGQQYAENGLYLVYRENVLRYFKPFDHEGPVYTYFLYLPVYLLPWALLLIPAILTLPQRFKTLSVESKWITLTTFLVFLFFTLSGSRRSYYILPLVPFAILFIADWLDSKPMHSLWQRSGAPLVASMALLFFIGIDVVPAWYYSLTGVNHFAKMLQAHPLSQPLSRYEVVLLDGESKLNFYLQLPPNTLHLHLMANRYKPAPSVLREAWPILFHKNQNTIFISRKAYLALLKPYFVNYTLVEDEPAPFSFLKDDNNSPIAFIPNA